MKLLEHFRNFTIFKKRNSVAPAPEPVAPDTEYVAPARVGRLTGGGVKNARDIHNSELMTNQYKGVRGNAKVARAYLTYGAEGVTDLKPHTQGTLKFINNVGVSAEVRSAESQAKANRRKPKKT